MNLKAPIRLLSITAKSAAKALKQNSAAATLVISGAGYLWAIVEGCRSTVKAVRNTDYCEDAKGSRLTAKELVEANWKYYLKPAALAVGSTAGLIFAGRSYGRQIANLAELCALSEAALKEKDAAMEKIFGEKGAIQVRDEIARARLQETPPESSRVTDTGKGTTLCLDKFSGRYFRSSITQVERGVNNANKRLLRLDYLSYNEFMDDISPVFEDIDFGDMVGWNMDADGFVEVHYTSALGPDGEPCLVMEFVKRPHIHFDRYS